MGFSFFVEMQLPHKTAQNPIYQKNILPKNPNLKQKV
jgi:hypothetical protein